MVDLNTLVVGLNFGLIIGIVVGIGYMMRIVSNLQIMIEKLERLDKKIIRMEDEELKALRKKK